MSVFYKPGTWHKHNSDVWHNHTRCPKLPQIPESNLQAKAQGPGPRQAPFPSILAIILLTVPTIQGVPTFSVSSHIDMHYAISTCANCAVPAVKIFPACDTDLCRTHLYRSGPIVHGAAW